MNSNIEIKARAANPERQRTLAASISDTPPERLHQRDVFFRTTTGRLKLRIFDPPESTRGELIYYERTDIEGPKRSHYVIATTDTPAEMESALTMAMGIHGCVEKIRTLYMSGRTRIHLDEVVDLGSFIELEYVMPADGTTEEGMAAVQEIMRRLEIGEQDLIAVAYIDLLASHLHPETRSSIPDTRPHDRA